MDKQFQKSILYSTGLHALLLFIFFLVYQSFLVVHTPLMMDLTLIGQMSQGNGLGAPSAKSGEVPNALPIASTNGDFGATHTTPANPPLDQSQRPEVAIKKPLKAQKHAGNSPDESYLESLTHEAPIGLENKKDVTTDIQTTTGLGRSGVAGTPDGNPTIEGELAARAIKTQVNPVYPDWAKKQGVEATVKFRLTVLPNGLLKEEDIQPEQTSGYKDLDQAVYVALVQWEFQPLDPGVAQVDQSGVITFSFSLKNQ
ncbi:MAG TPA: TonB family protein [bacterium]|jgi:TonB family protein|nr:TonB family protein [bacterium]